MANDDPSREHFDEESLAIRRAQAAREPADDDWQRYISWSLDCLGDVSLQGHDPDGARAAYEESLAIRRAYVARFPDRTCWSRDLAQSRDRIGHLDEVLGNAETAERLQTEADEICRDVRERDRRSGRAVS